jgi:hypothetical protein
MEYKILFIFIAILVAIILFYSFKTTENFNNVDITYLNQTEAYQFILSDPDSYIARFNKLDCQARNITNPYEYNDLWKDAVITPNDSQQEIILNAINNATTQIDKININWIDNSKLKSIPWKFIIINTNKIDLGLPHTRWDTIVINQSIINNTLNFVDTILHEKLHVYQKLFPEDFNIYLKTNAFEPYIKYIDSNIPYRSNPDTDDWIYKCNGKIYVSNYRYEYPKTIEDVIYTPTNSCDYEHPREKAVYDLLKTI